MSATMTPVIRTWTRTEPRRFRLINGAAELFLHRDAEIELRKLDDGLVRGRDLVADHVAKAHPADANFGIHLGSVALSQKKPALAEQRYRDVLKRSPDNVFALNNLAFVLTAQKKPGGVALAEKAVRLAPDQPALMDTLALSYAQDNQLDKALALQNRVVAANPEMPNYRLTLAKLQVEAGDKVGARAELSRLAAMGPAFESQDAVARLVATLGN